MEKLPDIIHTQTDNLVSRADEFTITSPIDLNQAALFTSEIKRFADTLDTRKKEITSPLNESLKKIRALFKPVEDRLEVAKELLNKKIVTYHTELEKENEVKKQAYLETVDPFADNAQVQKDLAPLEAGRKFAGGVGFMKTKDVEVTSPSLVPPTYWVLDMVKLRKDAFAGVKIPGVKVIIKKTVRISKI